MKVNSHLLKLGIFCCSFILLAVLISLPNQTFAQGSSLAESFHPYANNYEYTWTITEPGVSEMRLHFTKLELEPGDKVRLLDKDKNELTSYSGGYSYGVSLEDEWTEWFTGDTIKVKLETDDSGTTYGFLIDRKETRGTVPTPTQPTPTEPTPTLTPAPTPSSITQEQPPQPYVDLYGHMTDVIVGEEIILYLSVVNPITSPGTLVVQLTLRIPSGWSITSSGFGHGAGGLRTNTYEIGQGPNPQEIDVHILANESYEGIVFGYMDYYFKGEEETKYHGEARLPVTAELAQPTPEPTPVPPSPTPWWREPQWLVPVVIAGIACLAGIIRLIMIAGRGSRI